MQTLATVFLIDDGDGFFQSSEGLLSSVGIRLVRCASFEEFRNGWDHQSSGCVLVQLSSSAWDGVRIIRELQSIVNSPSIIALVGDSDAALIRRVAQHNVAAFIYRQISDSDLIDTIQSGIKRESELRVRRLRQLDIQSRYASLTESERQVMDMLIRGDELMVIADALNVSRRTIENRRDRLMKKLNVATFPALVAFAMECGILPPLDLPPLKPD